MSNETKSQTPPRLLTRAQAATYCNVSSATFSRWVSEGILPSPIPRTNRWDQRAIDIALDRIGGIQEQRVSALDGWKEARNARKP